MYDFKETMSRILNTVSILAVPNKEAVLGADAVTISSLVSTSVQEGEEEVMFVLRKNSHLAEKLKIRMLFSINVLSDSQSDIARFYGKSYPNADGLENSVTFKWGHMNAIPILIGSHINLSCMLEGLLVRQSSTLFFAKITGHEFIVNSHPLLHYQREYYSIDGKLMNN